MGAPMASPRSPTRRVPAVGTVIALLLALLVALNLQRPPHGPRAWEIMLVVVLCLGAATGWRVRELFNPVSIYVVVFSTFHFALLVLLDVSPDLRHRMGDLPIQWLGTQLAGTAAALAATGLVAFTAAATPLLGVRPREVLAAQPRQLALDSTRIRALGVAGLVLEVFGILLWLVQLQRVGGLGVSGEYLRILESSQTALAGYASLFVGVGLPLTVLGGPAVRRGGVAVFALFALVLFPLGMRGTVVFPLAAWLGARYLAGRRISLALVGLVGIGGLALSGIVRATRVAQADMARPAGVLDSVVNALAELGGSIFTVVIVEEWRLSAGNLDSLGSFLVVPLRWYEQLFTAQGAPPAEADTRFFNVKISLLNGPYGGSPVAESYHAWGWAGVVLVMALLGGAMGFVVRRGLSSPARLGYAVVFLFPLYVNIRNSFAPVPLQLALAFTGVLAIHLLVRLTRRGPQATGPAGVHAGGRVRPRVEHASAEAERQRLTP